MHNCFKQLRNFCVFLIKKAKPNYYETLDLGNITYSKIFWNTIKPLVSGDVANSNNIILAFGLKQVSSQKILRLKRCVKSVLVRSYSGPYFPAFGLNADQNNSEQGHFLRSEGPLHRGSQDPRHHLRWKSLQQLLTTVFDIVMTDLKKVLDCTSQELVIFKLSAFGCDEISLNFILSFVRIRTHSTKADSAFSELVKIISGTFLFLLYNCDFLY